MHYAWKGILLGTLLMSPALASAARPGAYQDCDSAKNAGNSTGRYFTSASFNRLACNEAGKEATEAALADVLKEYGELRTSDADAIKACYYAGLYDGYATQTADEYADCGSRGAFTAVTRSSLARMAEAIFVPASKLQDVGNKRVFVRFVFGIPDDFVAPCDVVCRNACKRALETLVYSDLPAANGELVDELTRVVCEGTP